MIPAILRRAALAVLLVMTSNLWAADVRVGAGGYATEFKIGSEKAPPSTIYRTPKLTGPVPTNKWYSSVLFDQWSQPLYAHPAAYHMSASGFEVSCPQKNVRFNPVREENDILYQHMASLTVKPLGFELKDARLDNFSDWAIDIALGDGRDALKATIAHGSPFSFYEVTRGDIQVQASGEPQVFHQSSDGRVVALSVNNQHFALYAPSGARWTTPEKDKFVLKLPAKARYFSIAALPNADVKTVEDFRRYAFAFVTDTRVTWSYDEARSQVTTTFTVATKAKEGKNTDALIALYPHQWHNNPLLGQTLPYEYDTVRGKMKTIAGKSFRTRYAYPGFLPYWPKLSDPDQAKRLSGYLENDLWVGETLVKPSAHGNGTYWQGKAFGRAMNVMIIAERQGNTDGRDKVLDMLRARLESWLRLDENPERYFYYDKTIGTLIGYPEEYNSAAEMNDHHFHYGYWIHAAAQIAMRDPQWASKKNWGGMIELMIADIATVDPKDRKFTRLRNFDPYEGHSWASGIVPFYDGNNQESSSEAINAWAGLILWGEATGNKAIRDLGVYLYTTEIQAINYYWFDRYRLVFAPEYTNVETSMVWGGKYEHRTWWSNNPREIHGINLLPLTSASTYLGADPEYVKRNMDAMDAESLKFQQQDTNAPPDIWQDVLLEYYAFYDAEEALRRWNDVGYIEDGETRTHTYYWLQSLANLGRVDTGITADTPFYQVFRKGDTLTYAMYNASAKRKKVRFSDGKTFDVPAKSMVHWRTTAKK